MVIFERFLSHLLSISLETSPWLLLGLVAAGLIKALVPDRLLMRWIGQGTFGPVARAAVIGAPLPLCSCGVIPAAIGLRRQGASPGATISFLVATPETGADSVAISYAMLGPMLMIARPIAAVVSALAAGLACQWISLRQPARAAVVGGVGGAEEVSGCCRAQASTGQMCCETGSGDAGGGCCSSEKSEGGMWLRIRSGLVYAATDLAHDLAMWLAIGVLLAAAVATFCSPTLLTQYGSGLPAMAVVALIGIPMYVCATASTPVAAAMLLAGVSPGTVLVFLLAGPVTNVATVALIRKELGTAVVATYLLTVIASAIVMGLLTDALSRWWGIDMPRQMVAAHTLMPTAVQWVCLVVLLVVMIRPLARRVLGQ